MAPAVILKPVPVIVTALPPAGGPLLGLMALLVTLPSLPQLVSGVPPVTMISLITPVPGWN